ncbi:GntR family transcriptional regulator [Novosphingobium sp. TCA1]|uniref:GntR family transcriptional regulator n=1 Tax=Novosphingobium sp. TCA1 TaxID=2682474 RepID=UPI00135B8FFF|nr:GntR family transcriptional regulator [Novosphingobium sp. TCA1]
MSFPAGGYAGQLHERRSHRHSRSLGAVLGCCAEGPPDLKGRLRDPSPAWRTQERVYWTLKADYLAGALVPGVRFDLQAFADRHRVSRTPLREAVFRLMGERLFERHPDGGFMVLSPQPAVLADLYTWNALLVLEPMRHIDAEKLAKLLRSLGDAPAPDNPVDLALQISRLFLMLVSEIGNQSAIDTMRNLNERLHYARIGECDSLPDAFKEHKLLLTTDVRDLQRVFRRRLESYHQRRIFLYLRQ